MVKIDLLIANIMKKGVQFKILRTKVKMYDGSKNFPSTTINEIIHQTVYDIIETNFIYILQSAMVNFYAALYNSRLQMTCNKR